MSEMPDRIWASEGGCAGFPVQGSTPYLRSTPAREAADEMLEALKAAKDAIHDCCEDDAYRILAAAIAKAEKKV